MEFKEIGPFLAYFERVRSRTLAVAARTPDDRFEWRPREGIFSPGDILRHLAGVERWMWVENAWGRPSRYPGHGPELAEGRDAVMEYVETLHAESVALLGMLTPDHLAARCATVGGADIVVWKWLRAMVEHEVHHRGQLYSLLALMGVETPPLYGLTEPEVLAASGGDEPPRPR